MENNHSELVWVNNKYSLRLSKIKYSHLAPSIHTLYATNLKPSKQSSPSQGRTIISIILHFKVNIIIIFNPILKPYFKKTIIVHHHKLINEHSSMHIAHIIIHFCTWLSNSLLFTYEIFTQCWKHSWFVIFQILAWLKKMYKAII